jgi:hypothetical protein
MTGGVWCVGCAVLTTTMTDMNTWYELEEAGTGIGDVRAYSVSRQEDAGGCLLIQLRVGTGAIVRHLFPRGTVEQLTSLTCPDERTHQVCVNSSFLVDSVMVEFVSALEALRFHWICAFQLSIA